MLSFPELTCPECHITYKYAADLLKHFAEHVERAEKNKFAKKMKKLPDLQPINKAFCKTNVSLRIEEMLCEKTVVDDLESPLKFCEVTMEDAAKTIDINKTKTVERKYHCSYCARSFGWSTDLKRHILTHTGEKPFECKLCNCKFTRNFLLQKHMLRQHVDEASRGSKSNVPPLKPIKIKRKAKSNNFELINSNLVCSN